MGDVVEVRGVLGLSPGFRVAACAGSVVFVSSSLALLARGRLRAARCCFFFLWSPGQQPRAGGCFLFFFLWAYYKRAPIPPAGPPRERPERRRATSLRQRVEEYSSRSVKYRAAAGPSAAGDME